MTTLQLPGAAAAEARLERARGNVDAAVNSLHVPGLDAETLKAAVIPTFVATAIDLLPGRHARKVALVQRVAGRFYGMAATILICGIEAERERASRG